MTTEEQLRHDNEVMNTAWQFLKKHATASGSTWEATMDEEFFDLYRKYNAPEHDFAHKILDAVLGEVLALHEGDK